jgi:hypothetical protein
MMTHMKDNTKKLTYQITTRLEGHKDEYYILRYYVDGVRITSKINTSKVRSYLEKIAKEQTYLAN